MNPKISITVDAKNKAIASLTGMVTVGAKVDVEIRGVSADGVPPWGEDDDFTGKSLRFRVVDECGRDLVRFPLVKKDAQSQSGGDAWTVTEDGAFVTQSGADGSPVVDFDTDRLREAFRCVQFSDTLEFGVIIDSIVDAAQYAVGRIKVRQWSACPTDDPTVLPDWRETLRKLAEDLSAVETAKADAVAAKNGAVAAKTAAETARGQAANFASAAATSATSAASEATEAAESASSASESAASAAGSAEAAGDSAEAAAEQVTKYPFIDPVTNHWMVWDATLPTPAFVDTGVVAKGQKGDSGTTPHIGGNGHWYIGDTDTGIPARGEQGAKGDPGTTSWSGITDKPQTFPPSAHQHQQGDVAGLPDALAKKLDKVPDENGGLTAVTVGDRISSSEQFSDAATYKLGDTVEHGGKLYVCTADPGVVVGPGEWSGQADYWKQTRVGQHSFSQGHKNTAGHYSVAEGYKVHADNSYCHAEGRYTFASGTTCHAEGRNTKAALNSSHSEGLFTAAEGAGSHASGVKAFAKSRTAYVWQGTDKQGTQGVPEDVSDAEAASVEKYEDHGAGTFNINPVGGAGGFWIGDKSMAQLLGVKMDKSGGTVSGVVDVSDWLAVGVENGGSDITGIFIRGSETGSPGNIVILGNGNVYGAYTFEDAKRGNFYASYGNFSDFITQGKLTEQLAPKLDKAAVIAPSSATVTGKAADALAVKKALSGITSDDIADFLKYKGEWATAILPYEAQGYIVYHNGYFWKYVGPNGSTYEEPGVDSYWDRYTPTEGFQKLSDLFSDANTLLTGVIERHGGGMQYDSATDEWYIETEEEEA